MSGTIPTVDNLVIGGGLAGSMVAIRLAAAGRSVTLFEKERAAHHKVCGDFLSPEAVAYLRQVGVEPLDLGASTIRFLRLTSRHRVAEAPLPFTAFSLSRYSLDESMLLRAAQSGCNVRRGVVVEELVAQDHAATVKLRDGRSLSAKTAFLATGKHDLRGWDRPPTSQSNFIGFKMHWRLTPFQTDSLNDFIEVFLFPCGYGGLSLIEDRMANLCLIVKRTAYRKIGGWPQLLANILSENRHLRLRLDGATPQWQRPLAISPIPYGYLASPRNNIWYVGDQAAVIPSFTGDGMSIALHSAALASGMFLAGKSADEYHRTLHSQLSHGISLAALGSLALVTRASNSLALILLSLFPDAVRWMASSTRVPKHALLELAAPSSSPELSCR